MHTLLVDDHHLFREGIKLILSDVSPSAEFYNAESCEAALALPAESIDLVLLDLGLPGISGREALDAIRAHFLHASVVVISGEDDPAKIRNVISGGAAGFIPKSSSPAVLLAALELIVAGGSYLPPHVLDDTPAASNHPDGDGHALHDAVASLSLRQQTVLARAIQGKINKVIGDELSIAEGTVKAHLSAAYRALGVHNRAEAVYVVTKNNLRLPVVQN